MGNNTPQNGGRAFDAQSAASWLWQGGMSEHRSLVPLVAHSEEGVIFLTEAAAGSRRPTKKRTHRENPPSPPLLSFHHSVQKCSISVLEQSPLFFEHTVGLALHLLLATTPSRTTTRKRKSQHGNACLVRQPTKKWSNKDTFPSNHGSVQQQLKSELERSPPFFKHCQESGVVSSPFAVGPPLCVVNQQAS